MLHMAPLWPLEPTDIYNINMRINEQLIKYLKLSSVMIIILYYFSYLLN